MINFLIVIVSRYDVNRSDESQISFPLFLLQTSSYDIISGRWAFLQLYKDILHFLLEWPNKGLLTVPIGFIGRSWYVICNPKTPILYLHFQISIHASGKYVTLVIEPRFHDWDIGLWLMSDSRKRGSIAKVTYFPEGCIVLEFSEFLKWAYHEQKNAKWTKSLLIFLHQRINPNISTSDWILYDSELFCVSLAWYKTGLSFQLLKSIE